MEKFFHNIKKGVFAKQRFYTGYSSFTIYSLLYFAYSPGFAATPFLCIFIYPLLYLFFNFFVKAHLKLNLKHKVSVRRHWPHILINYHLQLINRCSQCVHICLNSILIEKCLRLSCLHGNCCRLV